MYGSVVLCGLLTLQAISGFPSHRQRKDTAVTYSKCENTYDQCGEWKKSGLCELANYKDYMTMQCPVACGLCQQDAEGKIDTSKAPVYQAYNPASYAQPSSAAETGYQGSQQSNNNQYNPVADSAPYVPPGSLTSDSSQGADKPSETTITNSQFASNLLKPEESKEVTSELKKVSNDKFDDSTNEGTNEKDVSASKHIEREKLKDLTSDNVATSKPAKVKKKKGHKKTKARTVIKEMHESSGFHSGLGEEGSGSSMQGFSAESSGNKELSSGSGGVDFDETFEDLVDLVDDGFDDDLSDDNDDLLKRPNVFSTRLSPAGGETIHARSEIAEPEKDESDDSGSGSATSEKEAEISSNTHGESESAEENTHTKKEETNASTAEEQDEQNEGNEKVNEKEQEKVHHETQKENTNNAPHKAPEEDEQAEKYQDSEQQKSVSQESQKNYKKTKSYAKLAAKQQNLLGSMVDSGKLTAYAVHRGTQGSKVRADVAESNKDETAIQPGDITSATNDLFSASGMISGSGAEDNTLQVILRQTYDSKYSNENTPAFQILAGNFENDVEEALGGDSDVTDISFSEAEIEGNPRIVGKVKVTFKFKGDYKKLLDIVNTGNINGMLVMKNSLEGSIFDD